MPPNPPGESLFSLSDVLLVLAVPLFAVTAFLLGIAAWDAFLGRLAGEVGQEQTSFLQALRTVVLRRLGTLNRHLMWPSYEARLRRKLISAGEPANLKPEDVMALQQLGFVGAFLAGIVLCLSLKMSLMMSLFFGLGGLWMPYQWVNDKIKKRHLAITRALPYNLDLLTLSVEAGLDFTAALAKVVEKGKQGPLRDELQLVLKQLKMGKTREEALKSLVARVDLPALSNFIASLVQADRMGTPLGKVLRIQSTQLRLERTQRAEKLANEAPVKMLFPLIACIFPTVFMIIFGPILFRFMFGEMD